MILNVITETCVVLYCVQHYVVDNQDSQELVAIAITLLLLPCTSGEKQVSIGTLEASSGNMGRLIAFVGRTFM